MSVFMQCSTSHLPLPPPPSQFGGYASAVQQRHTADQHDRGSSLLEVGEAACRQKLPWIPPLSRRSSRPPPGRLITCASTSVDGPHSHWCFVKLWEHSVPLLQATSTDNRLPFLCKTKKQKTKKNQEVLAGSHLENHRANPPSPYIFTYLLTFTTRQLAQTHHMTLNDLLGALNSHFVSLVPT